MDRAAALPVWSRGGYQSTGHAASSYERRARSATALTEVLSDRLGT